MAPKLKLVYFDVRGRGELIRLILKAAGVDFEDERLSYTDWPARKPDAPNGQLPYMEIEGKRYGESLPLARYLARKYNLAGKNDLDVLSTDIILNMVDDLRNTIVRYKFDSVLTEEQKKSVFEKFSTEQCPAAFTKLESLLSVPANNSGYLVGNNLTIADLAVFDLCDQMNREISEFFTKYPKVKEHWDKIKVLPKLAPYLSERKDTNI